MCSPYDLSLQYAAKSNEVHQLHKGLVQAARLLGLVYMVPELSVCFPRCVKGFFHQAGS